MDINTVVHGIDYVVHAIEDATPTLTLFWQIYEYQQKRASQA